MRVKTGITRRKRHKKILKLAKGYRMTRHRLFKPAHEAVMHAGQYAYIGRKQKKRNFRRLWIARINAAAAFHGISYSKFMKLLKDKQVGINRKMLAHLAVKQPKVFQQIVDFAKSKK